MKPINKYKIYSLFGVAVIFYGCSASSSTRYGTTKEDGNNNQSSVRFTSEDDTLVVDLNLDLKDPSDLPETEPDIEMNDLIANYNVNNGSDVFSSDFGTTREQMLMEIIKYLGTPYKYGGTTKNGIDCSAFTQNLYKSILSYDLLRSARLQFTQGDEIRSIDELKFGDLVFFNTRKRVRPGHVGIYIGDGLFAHASSKKGVTISSIDHSYYASRYMGGRRIHANGLAESN